MKLSFPVSLKFAGCLAFGKSLNYFKLLFPYFNIGLDDFQNGFGL